MGNGGSVNFEADQNEQDRVAASTATARRVQVEQFHFKLAFLIIWPDASHFMLAKHLDVTTEVSFILYRVNTIHDHAAWYLTQLNIHR